MNGTRNEHLDRLARAATNAAGISDNDIDRISSSPFLHTRIRARIEAQEYNRAAQGSGWLAALTVASRAIAALVLVTMVAASAFWVSKANTMRKPTSNSKEDDVTRVVAGGTCALSSTDQCKISTEEVLATMFADENRKDQK